ncbi:MAG TPA: bifunctional diguanylate cyclase/phosphodiesterase [Kineosporiaceae bacterium]|nr:bifunctional diguanylate cyclase/phosphodiesterase [Kineosporiaceae bacterium]
MQAGQRGWGTGLPLLTAPVAAGAAAGAAVVVALALVRSGLDPVVPMVVAGTVPVLAAVALWPLRRWRGRPVPGYQRWFAAALAVSGAGHVVRALVVLAAAPGRPPSFPTAGDLVCLLSAPLAVTGLLTLARALPGLTGTGLPAVRILLDALLLGLSLALVIWLFAVEGLVTAAVGTTGLAVLALTADLVVGCMAGLLAVRRPEPSLLVAAIGVTAVVVGYVFVLRSSLSPGGRGWSPMGEALLVLGWPVITAGLLAHHPAGTRPADDPPVGVDARLTVVTVTGTALVLGLGVVTVLVHPLVDRVLLWLVLVLVVVVWIREMLTTGQRTSLLRRLHAEATLDPLTGLANRRDLTRRLARVSARHPWCLLTLDLDAFKTVNDVLGHDAGDRLLRAVAARLRDVVPPRAVVARVGGDEFAVLIPATDEEAQRLGEGLVAAVRRACNDVPRVDRLAVSASVGLAAVPVPGSGADPLSALSAAGAAQQLAKAAGRDHVQLFDADAARLRRRRLTLEERLRAAIAAGDVQLHYQPIVQLEGGRLAGVEALARWADAELGPVAPEEFIAVAEESGLVVPLGELVLAEAVRQAADANLARAGVRVSCNVSPLQLRVPGFHKVVESTLAAHRLPAEWVVVEVTEAALVEEDGVALRTLHRLVDLGVTIAIDDFGTGYSALGYLRRLPAQILKIDKSLTASLLEEPRARAITSAVTQLGRAIGLSVVIEGVESRDVADLVRDMGAQYGQGSLFGPACPLEQLAGMLQATGEPRRALTAVTLRDGAPKVSGGVADLSSSFTSPPPQRSPRATSP